MQYAVYRHAGNSKDYPYLLNIQSDLIGALNTRLVIPLFPLNRFTGNRPQYLCPVLHIENSDFLVMTHEMASVRQTMLGEVVCHVDHHRDEIKAAIDFLIDGF
ncbi:CcdB family protein [Pragia fontium]|uniref:CcdB family protein n=1 Tax=Pragia fontium TaxID=82985 RepID=UPI00064B62BF|nr:CcdB family protein [Pragia fontium]AKJ41722.1 cytotoxin [Pragia fontium]